MKSRLGLLLLLATLALPLLAQTRMIPHVTRVGGGFTTKVILQNAGVLDANITLQPYDAEGTALTAIEITIPGNGVIDSPSTELFVEGDQISHFTVDGPDAVSANVAYDFEGDGSPAHVPVSTVQASAWRLFPGDWSQVFDGIAVVNTGDVTTDVWIAQKDLNGNVLQASQVSTALAPNAKALFVIGSPTDTLFSQETPSYFEVTGDQRLAITALRGTLASAPIGLLWANDARAVSQATSKRDDKGVWFIRDGSLYDVFEMMGYNVAFDRLWQAELLRRLANGRLAEVFGPNFVPGDSFALVTAYSQTELEEAFAALSTENQTIIQGYVNGINRRIGEVASNDALLPFEFKALGLTTIQPWSYRDVLSAMTSIQRSFSLERLGFEQVDHGSLAQELIDFNEGDVATAARMFDDLRWVDDPRTPTIIPRSGPSKTNPLNRSDWSDMNPNLPDMRAEVARIRARFEHSEQMLREIGLELKSGSYGWVVSGERTDSGNPMLYAEPDFGQDAPTPVLEGSIESDAVTVSGLTLPGMPAFIMGRTPYHAWGLQLGHAHTWDYYFEDPEDFVLDRTEMIPVAGGDPVELPIFVTDRGPVFSTNLNLSWKYAMKGFEFDLAGGFLDMARATDMDAFGEAVRNIGMNQHVFYADRGGNIAYWMSGRVPFRQEGNYRFPQGFLPPLEWDANVVRIMPHIRNPEQGWLGGWNSRAGEDFPDMPATFALGPYQKGHMIQDYLAANDSMTFEDMLDLALQAATTRNFSGGGFQWPYMRDNAGFAAAVAANPTPERTAAVELIEAWNGHFPDGGRPAWRTAELLDDAYVIQRFWILRAVINTFDDELPPAGTLEEAHNRWGTFLHAADPDSGFENFYDWFQNNDETAPQTKDDIILRALDESLELLGDKPWSDALDNREFITFAHPLLGNIYRIPLYNRGTYAHAVEMGPDGPVRIDSVFPLGQSGTILEENGAPITVGGQALPVQGTPSADDPFFGMTEYYDQFLFRSFPLFGDQ